MTYALALPWRQNAARHHPRDTTTTMKLLQLAALATLLLALAAAALSKAELLAAAHTSKGHTIDVNDNNYKQLLQGPRDFHAVLLMTLTSSQLNCVLCNEFKPEYELVASSWLQEHPNGLDTDDAADSAAEGHARDVFFFYSEFKESRELFSLFQLNNIPKVFYLPPTKSRAATEYLQNHQEYQFFAGEHRDLLVAWLRDRTGLQFPIHVPPDYTRIVSNIVLVATAVMLGRVFWRHVTRVLTLRAVWGAVLLAVILLLISGYMFNQIRGVPYVRESGNGQVEYFAPGQQSQYGVETQILSFVYGCLSLFVIVLVKKVPEVKNSQVRLLAVAVVSALIFVFYLLLVSIFGLKGMGYPYRLLSIF